MDINEVTTTEDLWTPYKELAAVVDSYLSGGGGGAPYAVPTFESVLRRHKQTFLAMLTNPPKSQSSREEIKRGVTEGVTLPRVGRTVLSKELVDEALIISDMFNVNEYLALELLHTAQRQAPRHPGLARGLLAVLLYYDGRRALLQALRELLTARDGVCWSIAAREDIVKYVSGYAEQLVRDGVLGAALDALRAFTLAGELQLLQLHRALPPPHAHKRLAGAIQGTRKLLAGVVFAAAAQRGLERDTLLRLVHEETTSPSQGPTGALDEVSLALQMALLYALDLSVLHRREDGEELAKKLPLVTDPELIGIMIEELRPGPRHHSKETKCKAGGGARALCQLALGLALAALRRAPQSLAAAREHSHRDEELVDAALDNKVFEYLDEAILSTDLVLQEEFYQRRIHVLITDFIVLMHSKLIEMRVKADEAARAMQAYQASGLTPPAGAGPARTRLDALLRCVERLYLRDPGGLRLEYWQAAERAPNKSDGRATMLYKFVRLSGELVCPALLPGYLRALGSLSAPRHTWALLARHDALSAHHLLCALRRYHCNLRTDLPFSEPSHSASLGASAVLTPAARPGKMLVRHEEVEAMIAALKLIAAVAREDPAACAAICENLQWDAVNTMFGLMCCQIPLRLKAELCSTLGVLGGTPATAGRVWAALEAAQLVAERPQRGLAADLQEIESRTGEYPLTVAFLKLLLSLGGAAPVPRALGAGARPPGLDPYVRHVVAGVALQAPHRPYKRPEQKHQVLSLCYRLFALWLESYEPAPGDWGAAHREPDAAPPPGFRVLSLLHSDSDLLRLTLAALDEAPAPSALDTEGHQSDLDEWIMYALIILERALAVERAFVRSAAEAGRSVLVLGLSTLILEGSGGAGRLTAACALLQHLHARPALAARAAALLARALRHPAAARHLLDQARTDGALRHWFVECLDAEEWPESSAGIIRLAKELVVGCLQQVLPDAAPNLAHLLLGYRDCEDISSCALHEPGAGGAPRTCLHSILDLLDAHIAPHNAHERQADDLIERSYRLVYWLCARPGTSGPALRLLRARDHFLARHVCRARDLQTGSVATLSSRSWVLRACASEIAAACAARQPAGVAALLRTLAAPPRPDQEWEGEGCLLRRCLSSLPVGVEAPPEPHWELFNSAQLARAIASCDLPAGPSSKRISVSRLHALLARDLAALPATHQQKALVTAEIQKVLDHVTEVNKQRNMAATLTHYYDSWRQLAEIIFCVVPQDILDIETKKNLIISILQDILNKIPPTNQNTTATVPQLAVLASGTVLLLLVNLRHCYILQRRESNMTTTDFETSFFGASQIVQTKSLPLKLILHNILGWIFVSDDLTQKLRVNLYGALLNFLNIVNLKNPPDVDESQESTFVSRLDSSRIRPNKEESSLKSMVIDDLAYYGVNLYSIIGADCVRAGHDACRMVALACIDSLVEVDPGTDWVDTLCNQGFLRSLIDSIVSDDEGLRECVEPNPKSLRALYLYSSKMSLLVRVAGSRAGAEALLVHGALHALAELRALRVHPDVHRRAAADGFVPGEADRYRQVLLPALALCDALLTTLGSENESCVQLIVHLLHSNVECVDMVLRGAHPSSPAGVLEEVERLTSVLARCAACAGVGAGVGAGGAGAGAGGAGECLARARLLVAALLPRFARAEDAPARDAALHYKIVCNILMFTLHTVRWEGAGAGAGAGAEAEALPPHSGVVAALRSAVLRARRLPRQRPGARHRLRQAPADMKSGLWSGATEECLERQLQARCEHAACLALLLLWRMAQRTRQTEPARELSGAWQQKPELQTAELRKELASTFTERFTESLLDTAENQSTQRQFLDVIVKDIKTMMQF